MSSCNPPSPMCLNVSVTVRRYYDSIYLFSFFSTHFSSALMSHCHFSPVHHHFTLAFSFSLLTLRSFFPSTFSLPLLVSISPPDPDPQLYGVPVLLPTWAERLFPPGPPPGANDRTVPDKHKPLPHIQPRQQVGRTRTA